MPQFLEAVDWFERVVSVVVRGKLKESKNDVEFRVVDQEILGSGRADSARLSGVGLNE